jgi:mono/diheme cytochrome c family protein
MKQFLLLTVILGVGMFLITYCSIRRSEPVTGKVFVPANEQIANGERLYMMHCQKCHPAGEGGIGIAINPVPAPQFIKRFQVRHGLGVMPSFKKDEISKQELKDISKYMRALKHYK